MQLGYARVSKVEGQDTQAQVVALRAAGCERIYEERMSGGRWDRPELHRLLDHLRPGDVLVVWKLDRLSRSLRDLLHIIDRIEKAGAGFRSLTESVDTTTPAGRMLASLLAIFAEFERSMVIERTRAGLEQARREGRIGGRKPKLNPAQRKVAIEMVDSGKTAADVARLFGVHPSTVTRLIAASRQERPHE
ncbi:MAG: recombinase family protein [Gemmatimonadetes bacterium]|nr:recombinase family protein [Gemmatimonadota bacterium]